MSFNYQAVQKRNPLQPNEPQKYYATAVYKKDKINIRKIAKEIAERTSLSGTDTIAVLEALTQVLPSILMDSNIVHLGDFGSFKITLRSNGMPTADEVSADSINEFKLHFRPGKEFNELLKHVDTLKL